jgi:hypothetical protein
MKLERPTLGITDFMNATVVQPTRGQPEIFWGEIAPCEHLVQIYASDAAFLDMLEGFAAGGIQAGDSVVVIATPSHLHALEERLLARGFNLAAARGRDQYIALDAAETLAKFMVKSWPDDRRFHRLIRNLLSRGRAGGRRVRAFGEMVAVLWAQGRSGATVRLEKLWHELCQSEPLCLFCAYPRIGFTRDTEESMKEICATHSRVFTE